LSGQLSSYFLIEIFEWANRLSTVPFFIVILSLSDVIVKLKILNENVLTGC